MLEEEGKIMFQIHTNYENNFTNFLMNMIGILWKACGFFYQITNLFLFL